MKILINNSDLNEALNNAKNLGFVPTMGSLHQGHISLIKKSLNECNKTIVSIFINPTQFNNKNDYKKYPRNYKKDLAILKRLKVDYLYMPEIKNIYDSVRMTKIKLVEKDKILCAKYRKGHFEGVLDIMDRLTNKIKPQKIFMGKKDFQQLYLVRKYIEKKHKTKIVFCKTIRSHNKLAVSSRNFLLNKKYLNKAGKIAQNLITFKKLIRRKKNINEMIKSKKIELTKKFQINIEYFELRSLNNLKISNTIKNSNLFIAYYINNIRLIDNF